MLNQNFAFAEDYVAVSDEELASVQGGNSFWFNAGWLVGAAIGALRFVV
jgi:hypothetical protein